MVKVLIGEQTPEGSFSGYWGEFEGEEISSYENKGVICTLYKCTAYNWEAYRVHISNETDPQVPVYELCPDLEPRLGYTTPYTKEQIAESYPLFVKHTSYLQTRPIDPPSSS
jgi:hypothetical protein